MPIEIKPYQIQLLKLLFVVALFYWLLSKGNLDLSSFRSILSVQLVLVSVSISLIAVFVNSFRWWLLLKGRLFDVSYFKALSLTFVGLFFNFAMPGSVGGDVMKGYYICRDHTERKLDATFTILMDRLIGVYAMLSLAILGILLSWDQVRSNLIIMNLFWLMLIIAVGALSVFLFFLLQNDQAKWIKKISSYKFFGIQILLKILKALQSYKNNLQMLFAAYLLSFVSQLLAIMLFKYVGSLLGESLSFETYLFAVALGFISSSVPISPGGVGVGQVAFYFFFKTYTGQDLQVGAIGITVQQATMFLLGLVGGVLYLKMGKGKSFTVKELKI